jgi:hypothetical protein
MDVDTTGDMTSDSGGWTFVARGTSQVDTAVGQVALDPTDANMSVGSVNACKQAQLADLWVVGICLRQLCEPSRKTDRMKSTSGTASTVILQTRMTQRVFAFNGWYVTH